MNPRVNNSPSLIIFPQGQLAMVQYLSVNDETTGGQRTLRLVKAVAVNTATKKKAEVVKSTMLYQ